MDRLTRIKSLFGGFSCSTCNKTQPFSEKVPNEIVRALSCPHFKVVLIINQLYNFRIFVKSNCQICYKEYSSELKIGIQNQNLITSDVYNSQCCGNRMEIYISLSEEVIDQNDINDNNIIAYENNYNNNNNNNNNYNNNNNNLMNYNNMNNNSFNFNNFNYNDCMNMMNNMSMGMGFPNQFSMNNFNNNSSINNGMNMYNNMMMNFLNNMNNMNMDSNIASIMYNSFLNNNKNCQLNNHNMNNNINNNNYNNNNMNNNNKHNNNIHENKLNRHKNNINNVTTELDQANIIDLDKKKTLLQFLDESQNKIYKIFTSPNLTVKNALNDLLSQYPEIDYINDPLMINQTVINKDSLIRHCVLNSNSIIIIKNN